MKKRVFALIVIVSALLGGCAARADAAQTRTVFAMDTVMNLSAWGENAEAALADAEAELHRLDAQLARGTEGSAVYQLNRLGTVSDETVAYLLRQAQKIAGATFGAFDPTIAPVLELWGFGSGAGKHRVPDAWELETALASVGAERFLHVEGDTVTLDTGAVDLGGIAKGYAGQRVRDILSDAGIENAVLDLGGDVALLGKKPDGGAWRVAIRDPADGDAFLGILEASDTFVMTSGVYERYFEEGSKRYHHIIDPRTGCPADSGLVSATVICADGVWADALATAVCVLGTEQALQLRETLQHVMPFDLILVTDDDRVLYTCEGFTQEAGNSYAYEKAS